MTEAAVQPDGQDPNPKPNDPAALEAKNRELLGKLARSSAELKALRDQAAKVMELEPIKAKYDKLAAIVKELGVDPDKADPEKDRQKRADEQRQREEETAKRERAITRALVGSLPAGTSELAVEFALDRLMKDKTIVYNAESGAFDGLAEAKKALLSDQLFAVATQPPQGSTPPPPRLPRSGGADVGLDPKYAGAKTYADLHAMGFAALAEFQTKYPERYAALWDAHNRSLGRGRGNPAPAPVANRSH